MPHQLSTFLMFEGKAHEAMTFYVSLFPDGRIDSLQYREAGEPGAGLVKTARFTLAGQSLMCSDSPVPHGFTFTPSTSLFVTLDDASQIDTLFHALAEGGQVMMPLDSYDFSPRFGWVQDRYGVSWQLSWQTR
jgi:predicted 3-demethylubiquinone-9 3-methyltransferase (glyoxalase superfamily)